MIELIFTVYAAACIVATIVFIALGLARGRNTKSDILETMEEFEQVVAGDRSDLRLQAADLTDNTRGLSEPFPRLVGSPFPARSKATSAT
jgi:hypothetical protein